MLGLIHPETTKGREGWGWGAGKREGKQGEGGRRGRTGSNTYTKLTNSVGREVAEWLVLLSKGPKRPWTTTRTTAMLRRWDPGCAKQLVCSANFCFNCCTEQSHNDNVRSTAVEEPLNYVASTALQVYKPFRSAKHTCTLLM